MANQLQVVSTKEQKLAIAVSALDDRERAAYKYFCRSALVPIAKETSDDMFQLYLTGATCEDIRRTRIGFGLGQIVACKVQHEWDERRAQYRKDLSVNVPGRANQVYLEQVDFMADLLTVSQHSMKEKIRQYMLTGDVTFLKDVPVPKNMKDYKDLFELFMKGTGQEKKRIEVSGSVTVDNKTGIATALTPDQAGDLMDELLGNDTQDAEFTEAPEQPVAEESDTPKTSEEMIAFLEKTGVETDSAKSMVQSMEQAGGDIVGRYRSLVAELMKSKPDEEPI